MVELLAPAGDKESLIAAVQNGANAIYIGGTLFSARASAKNFSNDDLLWAVHYAHERDVKIYVTVNILYNDDEFLEIDQYIHYLYDIQVDALIIQDIGLFQFVKMRYPDFELHISTQATILNSASAQYFKSIGAKRVVLAREMSLEQIAAVTRNSDVDIEVFVHGALCVCYSGQCLMSSFIGKRSGNRGTCAQPCRLKYTLVENGKLLKSENPFLLSPKDIMTLEHVGELMDIGVTSFKIEGRMKRPEYVASVVKSYRRAIDSHLNKKTMSFDNEIAHMKAVFNRDYSVGYLKNDKKIIKGDYSGNKGIVVGEVIHYNKKAKRVSVKLTEAITQGDTLVFEEIDKGRPINKVFINDRLVSNGKSGDVVEIEFDSPVYKGKVRKTNDVLVLNELQQTYHKENIHLPLMMKLVAHKNTNPILTLQYKQFKEEIVYPYIVEEALNVPLTEERLMQQLSKLGQTPFRLNDIQFDIEPDISMPIKIVNEMRRLGTDSLSKQMREHVFHYKMKNKNLLPMNKDALSQKFMIEVSTLEQLQEILKFDIQEVVYPYTEDLETVIQTCHKQNVKLIINLPRINNEKEMNLIKTNDLLNNVDQVIINDYGLLDAFEERTCIIGTGLNLYNSYSINYYTCPVIVSHEMTKQQINNLTCNHNKLIVPIYGKKELMISEFCPVSNHYFKEQRKNCQLCKKAQYQLMDRKGEVLDLIMDEHCRMHLMNAHTQLVRQYKDINAGTMLIQFTNESINEVAQILTYYLKNDTSQIVGKDKLTFGYL